MSLAFEEERLLITIDETNCVLPSGRAKSTCLVYLIFTYLHAIPNSLSNQDHKMSGVASIGIPVSVYFIVVKFQALSFTYGISIRFIF